MAVCKVLHAAVDGCVARHGWRALPLDPRDLALPDPLCTLCRYNTAGRMCIFDVAAITVALEDEIREQELLQELPLKLRQQIRT